MTPSERISIQRTRPEDLGYRVNGIVIMAVRRVWYCRSSARRAWRNWSMEVGWADEGEYNAGERRDGITTRWIVCDGVDSSCCRIFCRIGGKCDAEVPAGGGIGT
jgi:hypothetical protein